MERVRNAGRRFDVFFGVGPAERGPPDALVEVNEFVIRARMQRIHPQQRLVERHRAVSPLGDLGAGEPAFLVVLVEREQLIERRGCLLLPLVSGVFGHMPRSCSFAVISSFSRWLVFGSSVFALLQCEILRRLEVSRRQRRLSETTRETQQRVRFRHRGLAPFLQGFRKAEPGERAIGVMLQGRLEVAGRFHPDVRVVIAERLIAERLALRRRRADAVAIDAEVRLNAGRAEPRDRHFLGGRSSDSASEARMESMAETAAGG